MLKDGGVDGDLICLDFPAFSCSGRHAINRRRRTSISGASGAAPCDQMRMGSNTWSLIFFLLRACTSVSVIRAGTALTSAIAFDLRFLKRAPSAHCIGRS